jgi:hypothetical protein
MPNQVYFAGTAALAGGSIREAMESYLKLSLYDIENKKNLVGVVLGKKKAASEEFESGLLQKECESIVESGKKEAATIAIKATGGLVQAGSGLAGAGTSLLMSKLQFFAPKQLTACNNTIETLTKNNDLLQTHAKTPIGGDLTAPKTEFQKDFNDWSKSHKYLENIDQNFLAKFDGPQTQSAQNSIHEALNEQVKIQANLTNTQATSGQNISTVFSSLGQLAGHSIEGGSAATTAAKAEQDKDRQLFSTITGIINNQATSAFDSDQKNCENLINSAQSALASLYEASHRG